MNSWQAFLLGVIEGITEYLPISSTGHLLLAQHLLGIGTQGELDKIASDCFAICIQGGAILAVIGLYLKRVIQMIRGLLGQDTEGLKLSTSVIIGFLPAAIIGVIFNDWIEKTLFGMWPIVIAWVVGGVAILAGSLWNSRKGATHTGGKSLMEMTWQMALIIGLLQCVAMWPGTSRSLMTIFGGLLVGLSLSAAIEYSFLLGVLTLTAATAKKALWKIHDPAALDYHVWLGGAKLMWVHYGPIPLIVGCLAAMISAALAVKWLVTYLQRHGLVCFGWYRILLGLLIGNLILANILPA